MDEEDRKDLEALVVGFLTSGLKENPNGFTLQQFERFFPERTDEPHDWYKRYKKRNTLEALECIQESVRVTFDPRYNATFISLNRKSDKVDQHLVDLVTNQRSSAKRKRPSSRPHYQKVLDSFAINRKYSNSSYKGSNFNSRLNYDHPSSRNENSFDKRKSSPSTLPSHGASKNNSWGFSTNNEPPRLAPGDPRNRPSALSMVPPQVRPPLPSSGPSAAKLPPTTTTTSSSKSTTQQTSSPRTQQRPLTPPTAKTATTTTTATNATTTSLTASRRPVERIHDDPTLEHKKSFVRQRLLYMLTRKYPEIKLIFLNSIYHLEYEENIDPVALGHRSLTSLIEDPFFSEYIKINYITPFVTVSARNIGKGKENIASSEGNRVSGIVELQDSQNTNGSDPLTDKSNTLSSARAKYNAIDPFNVRTMLQSLEPLREVREPPLGNNKVEDCIKYRTMRIIFKDPQLTLKLDDWEIRYQQEWNCKNKVQIRDYGFKTLLEFFKHLAAELPIKIRLNSQDEWIAIGDYNSLSGWLQKKMIEKCYRAITVIDAKYEQIAFPNEAYVHTGLKDLPKQEYYPVIIMSVKFPHKMWIQMRTQKRIEEHLCIEASLVCYEDYKKKGFFKVPEAFVKSGFPCVAYDEAQQRWCRAVIVKVPDRIDSNAIVSAFLVDYAITKSFPLSQLLCILKSHFKHPVGLVHAKLHNVSDDSVNAKRILQEYTSPPVTLACKIVGSFEIVQKDDECLPRSCYTVTLIDTRQGKDCNLADDINSYCLTPDD